MTDRTFTITFTQAEIDLLVTALGTHLPRPLTPGGFNPAPRAMTETDRHSVSTLTELFDRLALADILG